MRAPLSLILLCLASLYPISAWETDRVNVTCGSTIKLRNRSSLRHLHSIDVNYGSGSGQQAVLGTNAGDSADSLFVIRDDGTDKPCFQATPIENGARIRLQHARSGKWLHSHAQHKSPLTRNQEVSLFSPSDGGDVWVVEVLDGKKIWEQDANVRLKHADTGTFLASDNKEYGRPIEGYSEIYAKGGGKGDQFLFFATDGVYF